MGQINKIYMWAKQAGDILRGEDGYFMFWPDGRRGSLTASNLREIADGLDADNKPWDEQIARDMERYRREDNGEV